MTTQVYFIVTCARSGSTSLTQTLNRASNGICLTEPIPDINRECRDLTDGRATEDADAVLERTVFPRIRAIEGTMACYGEKHLTYGPFIKSLHRRLGCKFVFIKRDGRDVVRSLMDWHNLKFGTIYREACDIGGEAPKALASAANLPAHIDTSDYSRPRPNPRDPLYREWEQLSRFEMCAYYWDQVCNQYLDELGQIPADAWIAIDYTTPTPVDVLRVAEFVGLEGLTPDLVKDMLDKRINSIATRASQERVATEIKEESETKHSGFPKWRNWSAEMSSKFNRLAGSAMRRLGYDKN